MKYLVIGQVGELNLSSLYLNGKRNYDVVIHDYSKDGESEIIDNVLYIRKKGYKFPFLKWYFENYGNDYDYYLFLDDDVYITTNDINRLFEIASNENLTVAHPSINPKNFHAKMLYKQNYSKLRYVNWLEIMACLMSSNAVLKLHTYFDENRTGYGYPDLWWKILNDKKAFAIIDEIEIIHTKPMAEGGIYNTLENGLDSAIVEYNKLKDKFNIDKQHFETYGELLDRPPLSVVVIYNEYDEKNYLYEMFQTMPEFAEFIFCKTEQGEKEAFEIIEEGAKSVKCKYTYTGLFKFDEARNFAKSLARGMWVLSIDADERLVAYQENMLRELLLTTDETVGGLVVSVASIYGYLYENGKRARALFPAVRIFRNLPNITFFGNGHETVDKSIIDSGLKIIDTDLYIIHEGYLKNKDNMKEKLIRNIKTMWQDSRLIESDYHFEKMKQTFNHYSQL